MCFDITLAVKRFSEDSPISQSKNYQGKNRAPTKLIGQATAYKQEANPTFNSAEDMTKEDNEASPRKQLSSKSNTHTHTYK